MNIFKCLPSPQCIGENGGALCSLLDMTVVRLNGGLVTRVVPKVFDGVMGFKQYAMTTCALGSMEEIV